MITGVYDWDSIEAYPELGTTITPSQPTECAHVFSQSAQDVGKEYAATAFTMLDMFGLKDEVEKLLGGQVNSLCNVLTLVGLLHNFFDKFIFWLEPVWGQENTYDIVAQTKRFYYSIPGLVIPPRVTFNVDPAVVRECEERGLPVPDLPDSSLIAIRASCARVAHMSGAAEQSDQVLRDMERIPVLASDGSNADLLGSLLSRNLTRVEVSE